MISKKSDCTCGNKDEICWKCMCRPCEFECTACNRECLGGCENDFEKHLRKISESWLEYYTKQPYVKITGLSDWNLQSHIVDEEWSCVANHDNTCWWDDGPKECLVGIDDIPEDCPLRKKEYLVRLKR